MPNQVKQALLLRGILCFAQLVDSLGHQTFVDYHCLVCERNLIDLNFHERVMGTLLHPHGHTKHDVSDPALKYCGICYFSSIRVQLQLHQLELDRRNADIHLDFDNIAVLIFVSLGL